MQHVQQMATMQHLECLHLHLQDTFEREEELVRHMLVLAPRLRVARLSWHAAPSLVARVLLLCSICARWTCT